MTGSLESFSKAPDYCSGSMVLAYGGGCEITRLFTLLLPATGRCLPNQTIHIGIPAHLGGNPAASTVGRPEKEAFGLSVDGFRHSRHNGL